LPELVLIVFRRFILFYRRSGYYQAKNDLKGKKTNTIIKKVRETLQNFHNMCGDEIKIKLLLFIISKHVIFKRM
jgi:hypothetical protein